MTKHCLLNEILTAENVLNELERYTEDKQDNVHVLDSLSHIRNLTYNLMQEIDNLELILNGER